MRHNVIHEALDGILVEETATHALFAGNFAARSADDGIDVDNAETTLIRNVASRGDLGIEAIAGTRRPQPRGATATPRSA